MRHLKMPVKDRDLTATVRRLRDEIATLNKRLEQIGPDGDCGYERAMIRFYCDQIDLRQRWLSEVLREPIRNGRYQPGSTNAADGEAAANAVSRLR